MDMCESTLRATLRRRGADGCVALRERRVPTSLDAIAAMTTCGQADPVRGRD